MAEINSFPLIELAILPPGQSHYWFFDQPHDLYGWVFQATAHPEPAGEDGFPGETRVEVSEMFILCKKAEVHRGERHAQVNITVTNYSDRWAPYSLWLVSIPRRSTGRRSRRSSESSTGRDLTSRGAERGQYPA